MNRFERYRLIVLTFQENLCYSQTEYLYNCFFPNSTVIGVTLNTLIKNFQPTGEDILVFSSNKTSYDEVLVAVDHIKPAIIVHIGDHIIPAGRHQYNLLANKCKVYLRQHNHESYQFSDNTQIIPLGYTNYGFNNAGYVMNSATRWNEIIQSEIPLAKDRLYNWGWTGEVKSDRLEMITTFKTDTRNNLHPDLDKTRTGDINQSVEVLLNSLFTLQGRGFHSLNCFRLYEASICGSIPIVVGPPEEISWTFEQEQKPPWVFAASWKEAYEVYSSMLLDFDHIQSISEQLRKWWNLRIRGINNFIESRL